MMLPVDDFPSAKIDAILDRANLKGAIVGVAIETIQGERLYDRNPDVRLMPASNQKVLSVAYALWRLGPEFRPSTRIWKTKKGIVIDAPGDPSMTYEKLVAASRSLRPLPKAAVEVRQCYRPGYAPGWEWDDLPDRTAPTISALTFNGGSFELWGAPKRLWIRPNPFGIRLEHRPTQGKPNEFNLAARHLIVASAHPQLESKIEAFAYPNPDHLAAQIFGGWLRSTNSVPNAKPNLVIRGDSVAEMAKACLAPSDNFLAEGLLLLAASADGALPKDVYSEASKRFKKFLLDEVGLEPGDVDPYDGSGLSRHNNVTAEGLLKVLKWVKRQPWADLWMRSLAAPGVGTLKNRLQNSGFRGKTGTLNKASSLSGYVQCKDGRQLVVSILMNHYLGGDSVARGAQDEIIRVLEGAYSNGPKFALRLDYVHDLPDPHHRDIHDDRVCGPHLDCIAASTRLDHRAESANAALSRPGRVDVCIGEEHDALCRLVRVGMVLPAQH